jgi:hypothetical protein
MKITTDYEFINDVSCQGFEAEEITRILEKVKDFELRFLKIFKISAGTPLTLFLYHDDVLIGFAFLVKDAYNKKLPKMTVNSYGILGWLTEEFQPSEYLLNYCPVDVFYEILNYIKQYLKSTAMYCWSFDDIMLGFGGYHVEKETFKGNSIFAIKL